MYAVYLADWLKPVHKPVSKAFSQIAPGHSGSMSGSFQNKNKLRNIFEFFGNKIDNFYRQLSFARSNYKKSM